MRQPIDPRKIVALMQFHVQIMAKFKNGTLEGKVSVLMEKKAAEIGLSVSTFYARKNEFGVFRNGKSPKKKRISPIIKPK